MLPHFISHIRIPPDHRWWRIGEEGSAIQPRTLQDRWAGEGDTRLEEDGDKRFKLG